MYVYIYIYVTFIFPAMDFSYIHTSVHPGMHTYIHLCMHTYIHTRLEDVVRAEVSCTELEVAGSGFVGHKGKGFGRGKGARLQQRYANYAQNFNKGTQHQSH